MVTPSKDSVSGLPNTRGDVKLPILQLTFTTTRSKSKTKQGLFEDLEHVIAASFDPKGDAAQVVNCNWKEGGVMILSAQDKLRVVASMKEKPYTEIEKFQLLMSYLFELAYDVAIAPDVNVSKSPGFESFLMALASA